MPAGTVSLLLRDVRPPSADGVVNRVRLNYRSFPQGKCGFPNRRANLTTARCICKAFDKIFYKGLNPSFTEMAIPTFAGLS
jgi:hypothetical protein